MQKHSVDGGTPLVSLAFGAQNKTGVSGRSGEIECLASVSFCSVSGANVCLLVLITVAHNSATATCVQPARQLLNRKERRCQVNMTDPTPVKIPPTVTVSRPLTKTALTCNGRPFRNTRGAYTNPMDVSLSVLQRLLAPMLTLSATVAAWYPRQKAPTWTCALGATSPIPTASTIRIAHRHVGCTRRETIDRPADSRAKSGLRD